MQDGGTSSATRPPGIGEEEAPRPDCRIKSSPWESLPELKQ